ncbi:MAG: xanthine dehydrogenase family protein subunit M [Nitrososphaerota archaeon]|nr:xanthine dehydrogenase family protein subunit M [Nitrososphaerota archaeon]
MKYSHIKLLSPGSLDEALAFLHDHGAEARIISGGTDLSVYLKDDLVKESVIVDISKVKELRYIQEADGMVKLGARTTFSDCLGSHAVWRKATFLNEAAREVGSTQIRNLATVAGNVCNASPAADSLPPLYALEASVTLRSSLGEREVRLDEFILGPRKTRRNADELVTEVKFPAVDGHGNRFRKLGLRASQAISVVSVAALSAVDGWRIAMGAVGPTVVRAADAEEYLDRNGLTQASLKAASELVARAAKPITDVRGTAEYRKRAIEALAYQCLYDILYGQEGT